VRDNRTAFEEIKLRHRALVDVSGRSTATTLFGKPIALRWRSRPRAPRDCAGIVASWRWRRRPPKRISADVINRVDDRDGNDRDGGRGKVVVPALCLETPRSLVSNHRARESGGVRGLIVTVDSAVPGNREYNARNGFALPFNPSRNS